MIPLSYEHAIKVLTLDYPSTERRPHVALEAFAVLLQVLCSLLVQRIRRVRLKEEKLYPSAC
jgi:hypothetical protein